ncbi:MAG: aldose epimerase family protein [Erysipelotrichaceae bacterium]
MKTIWGNHEEQDIYLYTLENDRLRVEISNYGGIIRSLFVKDFNQDVVLGFSDLPDYIADQNYIGAVIGRHANRIAKGKFILNGKEYLLNINNGPHHLHGGVTGFDRRIFDVVEETSDSLTLHYLSGHKEEYYPGNLDFTVTFTIDEDSLILRYQGLSDKRTLFNPTHHDYFNLSNEATIENHELSIDSDKFAPIDTDGLSLYPPHKAVGMMDFNRYAKLSTRLHADLETIKFAKGLDHHFERRCDTLHPFIRLRYGDRNLSVITDAPGAHIYSGNYLDKTRISKTGSPYGCHAGICFETQFYPNSINNEAKIKSVLEAFEPKESTTQFRFYKREETRHD